VTIGALWYFIERSYRDGARQQEIVKIWPDLITVTHCDQTGRQQHWYAHPYWVQTKLHDNARIENYVTLRGNGREIELGAFLSPEERANLYTEVDRAILDMRRQGAPY